MQIASQVLSNSVPTLPFFHFPEVQMSPFLIVYNTSHTPSDHTLIIKLPPLIGSCFKYSRINTFSPLIPLRISVTIWYRKYRITMELRSCRVISLKIIFRPLGKYTSSPTNRSGFTVICSNPRSFSLLEDFFKLLSFPIQSPYFLHIPFTHKVPPSSYPTQDVLGRTDTLQ